MTKQELNNLAIMAIERIECVQSTAAAKLCKLSNVVRVRFNHNSIEYVAEFKDFTKNGRRALYRIDWSTETVSGVITNKELGNGA